MGPVKLKLLTGVRRIGASARSKAAALTTMHLRDRAGNELPARRPADPPLAFRIVSRSCAPETALVLEPRRRGKGTA